MSEIVALSNTSHSEYENTREDYVKFDDYRHICDLVNNFRKIGIQDEQAYLKVLDDPRTYFVDFEGKKIPLLAPIEFEKMYDEERCMKMTAKSNILLLSLPYDFAQDEYVQEQFRLDPDTAVIIETFVGQNDGPDERANDIPRFMTNNVKVVEFKHPDLAATPGHETAWMAGYSFEFGASGSDSKLLIEGELGDIVSRAWQARCIEIGQPLVPDSDSNETYVFSARELAEMPDVIEGLWGISTVGFGKTLGAHHPVAMEFNREFFDQQIVAPNTLTAVHFVEGQPVCFGFIGLDMSNNDWLNCQSSVMVADIEEARRANHPYVHFHELISNGFEGMGYSTNILKTFLDLAARTKLDYSVFFESTNLSSTYIPHIIKKEIAAHEDVAMKRDIQMIGKLTYSAIIRNDS